MEIKKVREDNKLTVCVSGRLDTMTAQELDEELENSLEGVTELVMDLSEMGYISSAGLRVLLTAQQIMEDQGSMVVKGIRDDLKDIFEVSGFDSFLNIQ